MLLWIGKKDISIFLFALVLILKTAVQCLENEGKLCIMKILDSLVDKSWHTCTWTLIIVSVCLGGLILAVVTFSLWPEITENLTLCPPARTLFVAMIIYLVEIFFFVWTVAYNFVPGGVYTREHTDYLIGCVCICIFLGLLSGKRKKITYMS